MLYDGKKVLLVKVFLMYFAFQFSEAYAQFKVGTTIFSIPSVSNTIREKVKLEGNKIIEYIDFKEAGSGDDKSYSLNIPIKQPDGSYAPEAISYSQSENTRTVTIPGQGSVNIIKDETGEFNLVLTPKQIKESSNVSCSVGLSGKGKCTIEPFVTMIGGKFLTADRLTVDYQNGQNLYISGGTATNLRLTEKDSTTTFNRSETKAGDAGFKVKFGADYKKDMEISIDTAQLVHTVSNPKDPSQTGTKFQVLGGGVSSNLVIDRRENTKIKFNGQTKGGIQYDSNPFSDKKVLVQTSAPVRATFDLNQNSESSNSALSLGLNALDKEGKQSILTIVDTRVDGKKKIVTSLGETYVNLNHTKGPTDSHVGVELGSEHLVLKNEFGNGNVNETEVFGLRGNAEIKGNGEKKIAMQADSLNSKNSKLNSQVQARGIEGAFQENDNKKKFELLTGHAYYSNGETLASVQGAQVSVTDYKNPQKAETFNGKAIKKDSVIIGSEVHIRNAGSSADLNNGVVIRQIDLADAGSVTLVNGKNGSLQSKDYNLQLKENFNLVFEQDNKGQPTFTRIEADDFSHQNKKGSLQILNSDTSLKSIGVGTDGKSGLEIKHSSDGIAYIKNNGAISTIVAGLKLEMKDTKTIKYGDVQFDQLIYKNENFKKQEELKIAGAKAVFFTDNTDPTNKIKKGELELGKLGVKASGQVFDIVAKDAQGVEGKFKIHLYQDGQTKNYQIFTDDGKRVYFDGVDKDNRHASVVLEAVKYIDTKDFKQVFAKNLAGNLQTIEGSSDKLQSFSIGSVSGLAKADGSQNQFVLNNGSFSETSPNRNINLSVSNVNYNQESISGKKESTIELEGGQASFQKGQTETQLKGLGIKAFSADKIKYGEVKFNQLKFNNGAPNAKEEINILGAKAVFFTDNTDPTNKIKKGELELGKLGVKASGQVFDIVAKDAQGVEGKFKIHLYQDGQTKNYQIFTDDGKRVYFDGVDKDNRHASVVLEAVKYIDTKDFKQVFAKNLSVKLQTVDGESEKLQAFSFGRVDGVINADSTKKQFVFTDGTITDIKAGTIKNLKFNQLEYDLETTDGKNISRKTIKDGSYSEENEDTKSDLSFAGLQDVKVTSDGKMISAKYIKDGTLNETNGSKTTSLTFNNLDKVTETVDGVKNLDVNLEGGEASYTQEQTKVVVNGLNVKSNISDLIKYGTVQFNQLTYKNEDFKKQEEVKITGAKAVIFTDNTDPTNKIKKGELELGKLGAKATGQVFDIVAKNAQGVEGKFKIHLYQDGQKKNYEIFTEDGNRIYFDGIDKNNGHAKVVLEAVKYLETKEFKQMFAKNLAVKLQTVDGKSEKLQAFSLGSLMVSKGSSSSETLLNDVNFSQSESGKISSNLNIQTLHVNQNNYLDTKDLKGELLNGVIKHVQYDGKKTSQAADLSIGSLLLNQQSKGKEKITMLSAKDLDVMVVDYNELIKLSGKVGAIDFFQNSQMQTVEVSNLKDIKIKDLSGGFAGTLNSDKIIRIVNKDSKGKEIGSYLLVNSTFLNAQDLKNGVNANLRVGVLELLQDKLTGQNVFLNADVNGKIILDKTKSPIAGEANFALKGQNLVTENKSYVSDDGNTVGKYFAINADPKGRLDNVNLSAGPSFLKDAISIEAKGSEKGGKSLNFTFQQDKGNGTYYVKAEFKNGDKVKVKLFPFTLESKVQGTDALAEVMLTPKGQNFYNHLEIISNVVSENEITDWLGVSNGGMLVARTGTLGGFGFEMMYQNKNYYNPENDLKGHAGADKAASIGAGIFHKNDKGDRLSAGVLLSGDSEFNLQTNGNGVLKIFGVGMDKDARIPATINLYMKKDWSDGDSLYGGVFIDTASLAVDSDRLNKNAAFHNGGRVAGKMGASVAYTKKLSDYSKITVAAGVNENFSSPAICVAYSVALDRKNSLKLKDLTSDTMQITNAMMKSYEEDPSSMQRSSIEGKIIALKIELGDLETSRSDALALERIKKALNETLESLNNKAPANLSFQNLTSIKEEDLNVLKKLEQKKATDKYSQDIEKLIKSVNEDIRMKRKIGRVSEKTSGLNQTLVKLTREFEENNSAEIHRKYLQKLEELSSLMGVTLSE